MDRHKILYYIGIAIVFLSHFYTVTVPAMRVHSLLNLFAGVCIAYYFMNQEGFIRW